jgi:1-acyl-sn-glycerol-3-phosphate acyltransferase
MRPNPVRGMLQRLLLFPIVRVLCRPLTVTGREHLAGGPYVFVANHSSHADTAVLLRALPARVRQRTAPAAAEDYFFSSRLKGRIVNLLTGAFPFPRHGSEGIKRAERLLARGYSVILFPEGTRSQNGRMNTFKPGIGVLASHGAQVVPVGVAGTCEVMPKGARVPRRAAVSVAFGTPMRFVRGAPAKPVSERLQKHVSGLKDRAQDHRSRERRSIYTRLRAWAGSRSALGFTFAWALAEAILWPVIPDFLIAPLAFLAPSRFVYFAAAATAGSVAGGTVAHLLAATGVGGSLLSAAPLTTDRMAAAAAGWLGSEGAAGLAHQPLSGVPYKLFALQSSGIPLGSFVWFTVLVRGARFAAIAAVFAGGGAALKDRAERVFVPLSAAYVALFALALNRVVETWR